MSYQPPEIKEYLYKILVVGDLGTGKTSIIKRYVHNIFSVHYKSTIGVDFAQKALQWSPDTVVRLQLWDIAGQERFGDMTRVYYKEALGALVVYDVTRSSTFDGVAKWKHDLDSKVSLPKAWGGGPIPAVLVANKCDLLKDSYSYKTESEMIKYCEEKGFVHWFETSAKENHNVDEAARYLVSEIMDIEEKNQGKTPKDSNGTINLHDEQRSHSEGCYEAKTNVIVGCSIAVIKKSVKGFSSVNSEESVKKNIAFRKKRKGGVLKDGIASELVLSKKASKADDTTESDNVNIEEKCLVEKTSIDYGERSLFMKGDSNQILKSLRLVTKKAVDTPLEKINFLDNVNDDNILLDTPVILPSLLKNLVNVFVQKSFAMDIELDKMTGKSFQKKLMVIICASFTSEASLVQTMEKMRAVNILVNTDLKKLTICLDRAVVVKEIPVRTLAETVHAVFSKFGSVVSIKMCAVVCFDSAVLIDAVMEITLVLKGVNLCWSYLSSAKCAKCENLCHTSLNCSVGGNVFSDGSVRRILSNDDKSRLASIYARCFASISCPVFFGDVSWANIVGRSSFPPLPVCNGSTVSSVFSKIKPILMVSVELNNRFAALECSLVSLVECINRLAKRLDSSEPMVSWPSPGCQPLVTFSLQNQEVNIVMSESLGVTTNGLSAKMDNAGLQEDVVYWHMESGSMVSIIMNKFDGVKIFSSGLDRKFLGAGVAIIMNNFLAHYVFKIKEISGCLVSVWLLFKSKLSVVILGLYASVFAETRFGQACKTNSVIAKAVNFFIFMVLSGDFNENGSRKSTSFKFCLDLELANSFSVKIIDYIFMSKNLLFVVASHKIVSVSDFFDMEYNTVLVSVGLGGLLDVWLNSNYKQANKNKWKFKIKNADANKWSCFRAYLLDRFLESMNVFNDAKANRDLDTMWEILKEVVISSADSVFSKHWFSVFNCQKNRQSLRFFKLELLVAKLIKCLSSGWKSEAARLFDVWFNLNDKGAFKTCTMFDCSENKENILDAINKCIENFSFNKRHMIKSVLKWPFKKMVLDHLIMDDKLILEPKEVKSTYALLSYVNDDVFSKIMNVIGSNEFLLVVKELPDGKAAGIFGIPNKLWKHGDVLVLGGLLDILNTCLELGILTNIRPIVLVKTARKILLKILSDRISLACSEFNVFCGDNFLVLKDTSTQILIFTIGLILDGLICKTTNWIITDFGLTDKYTVHDGLNQGEVKRHEQLCGYKLDSRFFTRTSRADSKSGRTLFFVAGTFVNNTIWKFDEIAILRGYLKQLLNLCPLYKELHNKTFRSTKFLDINTRIPTKHQKTSTNNNHPKVAESEIIRANHLEFAKSLFQQYSQPLKLNNNHFSAESAFNFYVNNKITDCLGGTVDIESARKNFYTELFQHISLPKNYSFVSIIREINQTIERYTQQQFPITYADKGKRRLQTLAKTRVELPTNLLYHYIAKSAINISLTGTSTSHTTLTFGQLLFQSKQKKAELLGTYGDYFEGFKLQLPMPLGFQSLSPQPDFENISPWKITESKKKEEEEAEDQKFT
ncbi:hypothetical protein G9A89_014751 [Geosiphon pyriformis]|nr:hypothetical protein G9A89_014751 [Geosiphon pyriformis]